MNPAKTAAEISGDPAIPSAVEMTSTTPELTQPTSPSTKPTRRRRKSKRRRTTGGLYLPEMLTHSSGQGRCIIKGKTYYLGPYDSEEAHERLNELRKRLLDGDPELLNPARTVNQVRTINDLMDAFWRHLDSEGKYRKAGKDTSQRDSIRTCFAEFLRMFPSLRTRSLTKRHLKEWRRALLQKKGLTLYGINRKVAYIKQLVAWGCDEELVPDSVLARVQQLRPLSRESVENRNEEVRKRRALSDEEITRCLPLLSRNVRGLIQFQLLTGCRPGEACALRMLDIDRNPLNAKDGEWVYTVARPKTEHHGRAVKYMLNAAARALVMEYADSPSGHVFHWKGKQLLVDSYSKSIARACKEAGVRHWSAHELRHTVITKVFATHGLAAASALACHASPLITQKYLHVEDVVDKSKFVRELSLPRALAQA